MIVYSISDYSGALIIIYSKCCKSSEIIQSSKRSHLSSIEAKDVFLDSDDFRESVTCKKVTRILVVPKIMMNSLNKQYNSQH